MSHNYLIEVYPQTLLVEYIASLFISYYHLDMVSTAEYLPYLHLDDVFITGILAWTIGVNHVFWPNYRHVTFFQNMYYSLMCIFVEFLPKCHKLYL